MVEMKDVRQRAAFFLAALEPVSEALHLLVRATPAATKERAREQNRARDREAVSKQQFASTFTSRGQRKSASDAEPEASAMACEDACTCAGSGASGWDISSIIRCASRRTRYGTGFC